MKKLGRKVFKITLLSFFAGLLTIVIILLFPQRLFANKIKHKEFTIYSNDKIDGNIKIALDNAKALVLRSELYNSGYTYNIILCHNTIYNKIDDRFLGFGPAARQRLRNVIIKVRIDPKNNLAFATFPKPCEVDLTYLLAHEMIHCLQAKKYGLLKFNPFTHPPFWKLEGYPEYISKRPERLKEDYSLPHEIKHYVDLKNKAKDAWIVAQEGGCEAPDYYYKGRLMMEYLIDVKHLTYDQILKDSVSENTIFNEMIKWSNSTRLQPH